MHALLRPAAGRAGTGLRQGLPDPVHPVRTGQGAAPQRRERVEALHAQGVTEARLYGADDSVYGGLNAFFLLMDEPEVYGLPNAENAVLPSRNNAVSYLATLVTGGGRGARWSDRAAPAPGAAGRPTGGSRRPAPVPARRTWRRAVMTAGRANTSSATPTGPGTSCSTSSWPGSRAGRTCSPSLLRLGGNRATSPPPGSASTWRFPRCCSARCCSPSTSASRCGSGTCW